MKEEPKLIMEDGVLALSDGELSMTGDFSKLIPRLKQSNLEREMLVKAARIKGFEGTLKVFDATAGMGEDSLILAAAGFDVTLCEYNETIAKLLEDALKRAMDDKALAPVVSRMKLINGDSIKVMKDIKADVIYLDPMFPERKKSGLIKKKFQLLQGLERPCDNENELFEAAINAGPKKIVVKRPAGAPALADKKPSYTVPGKVIRYDCYLIN